MVSTGSDVISNGNEITELCLQEPAPLFDLYFPDRPGSLRYSDGDYVTEENESATISIVQHGWVKFSRKFGIVNVRYHESWKAEGFTEESSLTAEPAWYGLNLTEFKAGSG